MQGVQFDGLGDGRDGCSFFPPILGSQRVSFSGLSGHFECRVFIGRKEVIVISSGQNHTVGPVRDGYFPPTYDIVFNILHTGVYGMGFAQ